MTLDRDQQPGSPRRSSGSTSELIRAAAVARRYFIDRVTKQAIAEQFGISRFKVARLLDLARDAGLVQIDVRAPLVIDVEISDQLQRTFGLKEAWVVTDTELHGRETHGRLGEVGALMLTETAKADDAIGIAWGRTMRALVDAAHGLPSCPTIQVAGGLPDDSGDGAAELVRRLAQISGGRPYLLHAPLFVADPSIAASLRAEPAIARTLDRFGDLRTVLLGVGRWDAERSAVARTLKPRDIKALDKAGTVAELCGLFLAEDGSSTLPELAERAVAISERHLRDVPDVIVVAGGREKAQAIAAVVRSGLCTRLVTDPAGASALVDSRP